MSFFKHLVGMMGGHGSRGYGGGHGGGHHGGGNPFGWGNQPPGYGGPPPGAPPTIACPKCGVANAPGARFCQQCGGPLGATKCASCSADIPPNAKFCPQCGKQP